MKTFVIMQRGSERVRRWLMAGVLTTLGLAASAWSQVTFTVTPTNPAVGTLDFGSVPLKQTKVIKATITHNAHNESVTFANSDATISGPFSMQAGDNDCKGKTLATGEECFIFVRFKPAAVTSYASFLNLALTTPAQHPGIYIDLTGSGVDPGYVTGTPAPLLVLDSSQLDFGDVRIGETKNLQVILVNPGSASLSAQVQSDAAEFIPLRGGCIVGASVQIGAGQSCKLTVQFKPTAIGATNGKVTFPGSSVTEGIELLLKGRGVATATTASSGLIAERKEVDFGAVMIGNPSVQQVTLRTASGKPTLIRPLEAPPGFVASDNCDTAVGNSCTLTLTFTPQAEQAYQGWVILTASDLSTAVITVRGTGSRSTRMTAQTRGSGEALDVVGQFEFAADLAGSEGNLYVAMLYQGSLFFLANGQWATYQAGSEPAPYVRGPLRSTELTILAGQNVSGYAGAMVFLGYGRNLDDLLSKRQYAPVFVIE